MSKEGSTKKNETRMRPPIVVVMGHVDHGKTALLDYIRKTNVVGKEAGGITQSIGAYEIEHGGKKVTFIDTPGHEAFSKMRGHGARVADLAILVVAADEGVKPQTEDALKYILKEKITFVVAINKIDKPNANIEKVKQELGKKGVLLEGFGGNVSWQAVSAKTGEGVNDLLDLILLAAELENLTYNPESPASGIVLTGHLDSRRGLVAGVIVTNGKLQRSQPLFTESAKGKVKILEDFQGNQIALLEPSAPAMILGFETLPEIGEEFFTDPSQIRKEPRVSGTAPKATVDKEVSSDEVAGEGKKINVILKADEAGSLDALEHIIQKLTNQVSITIIDKGIGAISENNIKHAATTGAIIVGFKVKEDKAAINMAKIQNVTIMTSAIIYELEKQLEEYIQEETSEKGRIVEILALFGKREESKSLDGASLDTSRDRRGKQTVGGKVLQGPIKNQEPFTVLRDEKEIGSGKIINLQSGKKNVTQIESEQEAGFLVERGVVIQVGDKLVFKGLL